MHQLVDILIHMNDIKKIAHLDIKSANLLLDEKLDLKITDFGCAAYNQIDKLNEYTGTRPYMAPEIIEGEIFDGRKADVFSLGVLLFQIVVGRFPFSSAKDTDNDYKLIIDNQNEKLDKYRKRLK